MIKDKQILLFLLACLLVLMPILSLDAGISGDEEVNLKHAEKVVDYFKSFGKDRSALHTPETNLKYYGQSVDNITTLLAQTFGVKDVYTFRHICNSIIGWLCILFTALITIYLSGYRAAIFAVLILAASPRFIGHSLNNPKDIPFALGYIASLYFMLKVFEDIRNIKIKYTIGLVLAMAFTLSIRPGGLLVFCYFWLYYIVQLTIEYKKNTINNKLVISTFKKISLITIAAYFIGLLFWPYALENPLLNPFKSLNVMSNYPVILRQLFEGTVYWSDQLPWYYLIKYVVITIPIIVIPLSITFILRLTLRKQTQIILAQGIIILAFIFPFIYTILANSNVYGAWRHLLFTYLPLVILASIGFSWIIDFIKTKSIKDVVVSIFILSLLPSSLYIYRNHPLEYTYFNTLAGPTEKVAKNYELDYYYHSVREASLWLKEHIENEELDSIKVASNYGIGNYLVVKGKDIDFNYTPYYARGNEDWDYGIFYRTSISPSQTSHKLWPPVGTIHSIKTEGIPVCVIVKRQTKADYYGKIAYENEDFSHAITILTKATQVDPANEIAWINLGKSYLKLLRYKEAKVAFKQCLDLIPDYEPSMYYLAQIESETNNPDKAEEYYKKIIHNNNKSFKTYLAYARLQHKQKLKNDAYALLEKCLKLNPNYKPALLLKQEITKNK